MFQLFVCIYKNIKSAVGKGGKIYTEKVAERTAYIR